ncbi:glycosyltransferase family 4 protein [bacterium]|nr:glycosyltransferase family 4 protein [bacterium]
MRVVLVYELFFPPFDEGAKKFARQICDVLNERHEVSVVHDMQRGAGRIDRVLLVPRAILRALRFRAERVIYLPQASLTFASFLRMGLLRFFLRSRLRVVGLQKRSLRGIGARLARSLACGRIFTTSRGMQRELDEIGIQTKLLDTGIDRDRFSPGGDKAALRAKYGVPVDRKIVLHVGHVRESRNVEWLLEAQRALPEMQFVLVGSTATEQEEALAGRLQEAGVIVRREYLPHIEEMYQLADCYCFPVNRETAAIETPLSVLEAMAANLPVVTTRFGRLPELFEEDGSLRYANTASEMIEVLRHGFPAECANRGKTELFTWGRVVDALLEE